MTASSINWEWKLASLYELLQDPADLLTPIIALKLLKAKITYSTEQLLWQQGYNFNNNICFIWRIANNTLCYYFGPYSSYQRLHIST